jgi:hypothetical protein
MKYFTKNAANFREIGIHKVVSLALAKKYRQILKGS